MGFTKRLWEREQHERQAKQEALLDLPSKVADMSELLNDLNAELEHSTVKIGELERQLAASNSSKSKIGDYLIGGFVGALMGFALSMLMR